MNGIRVSQLTRMESYDLQDGDMFLIVDSSEMAHKSVTLGTLRDYLVYGPGSPVRKSAGGYDNEMAKRMIERFKKLTRQK